MPNTKETIYFNGLQNVKILTLTKQLAYIHSDVLLAIHNIIPYQSWTENDLLSDSDNYRNYINKWEHSKVCFLSGVVTGLCIAFETDWGLYVHRLVVDVQWRLKYIGSSLVCCSIHSFANSNIRERLVRVQTPVEQSREKQIRGFYEKLGFIIIGTKKYKERKDYIMESTTEAILIACERTLGSTIK